MGNTKDALRRSRIWLLCIVAGIIFAATHPMPDPDKLRQWLDGRLFISQGKPQ